MAFHNCRKCKGRGCIWCDEEADKQYKEAFPDGPKPLMTARLDDEVAMAKLASIFHADRIAETFGPGGGGMAEIFRKVKETNGGAA